MDKSFWEQRWKDKEVGFNQAQPNRFLVEYFSYLNLDIGATVFVPLCGKSVDMMWLLSEGFKVVGAELDESACREFFEENNIQMSVKKSGDFVLFEGESISLIAGDFFGLTQKMTGSFDAIYDRAALIALPSEMRKTYVSKLDELSDPKAKVLLITFSYDQAQMPGPPFSVNQEEVNKHYAALYNLKQVYSGENVNIPAHLNTKGLRQTLDEVYVN